MSVRVALAAGITGSLALAQPAEAASFQKVEQSDWWQGRDDLPGYVNMFEYVPDQLSESPPIVVAPHHCQGSGQSTFSEMASLVAIADQTGFIMIFPEATGQNCWDAGSTRSLTHGGGGDTGAIVQMVSYVLETHGADEARVYVVGGSSGGIMTEALLGVYPDVFLAGVSLMGVPCGCWAEGYNDVTGSGSSAQWSGPCSGGNVSMSGQEWGDLVRSFFPGYQGPWPRLQHWHGTADTTLDYKNVAEDVKQWTNLLGLEEAPTGSDMPEAGTTREYWQDDCGFTVYETFSLAGVAHAVPFDGPAVATYFGLDAPGQQDPQIEACGPVGGGSGGSGSGGSGAGGTASGGVSAVGGSSGAGTAGGSTGGAIGAGGQAGSGGVSTGGTTQAPAGGSGGSSGPETGGSPAAGGVFSSTGGVDAGGTSSGGSAPTSGSGAVAPGAGGAGTENPGGCAFTAGAPRGGSLRRIGVLVLGALILLGRWTRRLTAPGLL